jgi:methylated-DNA-protein-cysteine methyltransferase-like protein
VADFETEVEAVLLALRPGDVMTYGEVASEAGYPGAARAVGGVLARSGDQYPWWRVVAANGRLVPGHEREHQRRLEAEGVAVVAGRVRMRRRGGSR